MATTRGRRTRRAIIDWLEARVPHAKRVVITDTDASWGSGFEELPSSRRAAITVLADVIAVWELDQRIEQSLDDWLSSLGPVPVVSEDDWRARLAE